MKQTSMGHVDSGPEPHRCGAVAFEVLRKVDGTKGGG